MSRLLIAGGFGLAVACAAGSAHAESYVNRIHSQRTGPQKCLGIHENQLNHPFMARCANYAATFWSVDRVGGNGAFKLRSRRTGPNRCLGVAAADRSRLIVAPCGGYKNQVFYVSPSNAPGYSLIHSALTGPGNCLGIAEAGGAVNLDMRPCGNYAGQNWTISP